MAEAQDRLNEATVAFRRGNFAAARAALESALEAHESGRIHGMLAGVCLALEDLDATRRHGEAAYRLHQEAGDVCEAAGAALLLAHMHDWLDHDVAVRGWVARAERLLADTGPCVERGYLVLARAACDVHDVEALEASADIALEIARQFHDLDLEARALGDGGLALVCQGRVREGLARLDEAMAAVVSGDVGQHMVAGLTCCAMLTACERLGDSSRAGQWIDAVRLYSTDRFGEPPPQVLRSHCRLTYGGLLAAAGSWNEAEAEYRRVLDGTKALPKHAVARGAIAELCIRQNRFAEAEEALLGLEDRVEAAGGMARLHLARGELDMAAATLERAMLALETDLLRSAPLLALHVETEIERGDLDMAATSAARLKWIAVETRLPAFTALAQFNSGRVAAARGDNPVASFRAALQALAGGGSPPLAADIHLQLAGALAETDTAAAIAEARAALAVFERLGARRGCDEAAALLRRLGVTTRASGRTNGGDLDTLSRREREVLPLIAEGLSNAEIAGRLFITARTAEHHVSSILAKLQLRSRAEVAAHAASQRLRAAEAGAVRP